ncbi:MAG: hypothetical protein J3Q66DRAFT_375446 [Benniella sp.]|nr:MAG: hypothetical protein J3Q66DRAFT_375446 [Benniella sp.]
MEVRVGLLQRPETPGLVGLTQFIVLLYQPSTQLYLLFSNVSETTKTINNWYKMEFVYRFLAEDPDVAKRPDHPGITNFWSLIHCWTGLGAGQNSIPRFWTTWTQCIIATSDRST